MKKGKRIAPKNAKNEDTNGAKTSGEKSPKRRRRSRTKLTLTIICGIVLVSGILLAYFFWPKMPPLPPLPSNVVSLAPNTQVSETPSGSPINTQPGSNGIQYNKDVRIFLGIGVFDGSNTDTIMVAAVNYKKYTMSVISIPRDTTIEYNGKRTKINSVHARAGGNKNGAGMASLTEELGKLLGFYPGSTAYIRANAFKDAVDAVGGVDFNVPVNLYKPEENINLKAGQKTLNGEQALMLMRYRGYSSKNTAGIAHDDFGRIQMQQEFLMAAAKQMLVVKNIPKIPEFVGIFTDNVTTSLTTNEITGLAETMMEIMKRNPDGITFHTLPTTSVDKAYEYMRVPEALELLNATVNPYTTPITEDMIQCSYPAK